MSGDGEAAIAVCISTASGRVPSLNRNRAAIADPRLWDVINQWAVEKFPRFVSANAVAADREEDQESGTERGEE